MQLLGFSQYVKCRGSQVSNARCWSKSCLGQHYPQKSLLLPITRHLAHVQFSLLLAQPSVCEGNGSYTWQEVLYQHRQYHLRFTSFAEIMAPAIRLDFFQHVVRHTLAGAYTGKTFCRQKKAASDA